MIKSIITMMLTLNTTFGCVAMHVTLAKTVRNVDNYFHKVQNFNMLHHILQWTAAGETGDHGHPIAPPTVYKAKIGRGRGQERAPILFHREMDLTVLEKTPTNVFVVDHLSLF